MRCFKLGTGDPFVRAGGYENNLAAVSGPWEPWKTLGAIGEKGKIYIDL